MRSTQPLNPAQRAVVELLGRRPDAEPVTFPPDVALHLQSAIEADLVEYAGVLSPEEPLVVTKHLLTGLHGCQARALADRAQPFRPSIAALRGAVVHKAIELSVHWRDEPLPAPLVTAAIDSVVERDHWAGQHVAALSAAELAELAGEATDLVTRFLECFPPLKPQWRPVTETTVRVELLGGRVVLKGRPDLVLGRVVADTPGKVVIDLKSGPAQPTHREDLRFYALVETLRMRVPPRLVATYELDAARVHPEELTLAHLEAAARRTADGIVKLIGLLHLDRTASRVAGPACAWCPLATDCEAGQAFLAERAEREGW